MEVIVIGGNHHNTLSVLRALGRMGIMPHLVMVTNIRHPYTAYSKYKKSYTKLSSVTDLPKCLLSHFKSSGKPSLVIACGDKVASELDLNRDILAPYFILPGSKEQGRITRLMNKEIMGQLALESGLKIPTSTTIDVDEIGEAFLEGLEYPCIVKPIISIIGEKSDIHIFKNACDFKQNLSEIKCSRVQIQKFIDKEIEYQLIGCSLDGGSQIVIPGMSIILRQPENTNTGFLKYVPANEFSYDIQACEKFMKATGYSGLFSMEFLRDRNGIDYFMEINFRNDGNAICVTTAGVNLPYIWYLGNSGMDVNMYLSRTKTRQVFVMPEIDDLRMVKAGKLSFIQWLKDWKRSDAFMEFCKDDPAPLMHFIVERIVH